MDVRRRMQRLRSALAPEPSTTSFDFDDYAASEIASDGFPVVPPPLRHSSAPDFESWLAGGREHFESMLAILRQHALPETPGTRILDYGCSSGRTVRNWGRHEWAEVWGCEIDFDRTQWCRRNLGHVRQTAHGENRFRFVQTRERPPLPFEDGMFDLIYAGSVFTHISHYIDQWLLELRRVLRPGGQFFVTIHDETTWRIVREQGSAIIGGVVDRAGGEAKELPQDFLTVGKDAASQVFFRSDYFRALVEPFFEIQAFVPEARGYQSAFLLKKPC